MFVCEEDIKVIVPAFGNFIALLRRRYNCAFIFFPVRSLSMLDAMSITINTVDTFLSSWRLQSKELL